MSSGLRSFVFSIQTKLAVGMTLVIVLAILLAGAVFVAKTRNDQREQALNRVAAASPAIYQEALSSLYRQPEQDLPDFYATLDRLAKTQDVRILLLSNDGTVQHDTSSGLTGRRILAPTITTDDVKRGYVAWRPPDGSDGHNLTLIAAASTFVTGGRQLPFTIVLAARNDTIASAWLGVLPGLGLAALVAIPLAILAALIFARQIAQPLRKLDAASEALAGGDFGQRVLVYRDDEVGRLSRSFTRMAERVGERDTQMRTLLANVSHDLKTPMTSITGYAQSLTDGTAAPHEVERIANVIREEAEHVNSLVADLLYLGEIDAGHVLTHEEDVPLEALVARCVRRIEPTVHAKNIDVHVDVAPDATLVRIDPDKLERALTNVLDNATKFTPDGGDINVSGWRENGTLPARIYCAVRNSGPPIPAEDLPRLFDRFFRGDRARRSSNGSGLGLAISRQLVELNRGQIAARNDGDGHVLFTMVLPG